MTAETDLQERLRDLQERFDGAEETLRAIRSGEVDAIVASGPDGARVYTLTGADEAYRVIVEGMAEGALTVTVDGLILFSNERFSTLVNTPLERVIGSRIQEFVAPEDAAILSTVLSSGSNGGRDEIWLRAGGAELVPVYLSAENLILDGETCLCLIVTDLSEQKRNERLAVAERLARSILEQAAEAIVMVNPDGQISRASAAAERLAGSPVVRKWFDEIFRITLGSGAAYPFRQVLSAVKQHQAIKNLEVTALTAGGQKIELLLSAAPLMGAHSQLLGCVLNLTDITERKKAEERLQLFQALVEGVQDYGISMLDPDGYVFTWNVSEERMTGYSAGEIMGKHVSCFYTPEDVSADRPGNALRTARAIGKFEDEGWRVRRDGSRFWANVLITPLLDKDGNPHGFSKLTRDITERKQARELLLESERSLRLLADAMPQMVWTARPDGQLDYYNQRWYEFKGSSNGQDGQDKWKSILHPDDVQRCLDAWYAAVDSGDPYEIEYRFRDRKSGDYRWYLARALPQRDDRGEITKWVGTATDIDDRKRLSEELEKRVEERTKDLRQSLAEKTTLLQEVHHRVKNNLQVVGSLLSMQIACADDDSFTAPLHAAHARVLAMSLIHEQIYRSDTLADLEFGEYVKLLAGRLYDAYCVDSSRIQLELSLETMRLTVDHAIPCGLILNELVSNSLKHAFGDGRDGVIRISLRKTDSGYVELTVADNGIGLPADFQLKQSRSLGLQVVDTLIRQLRADLSVKGDTGASFRFGWKLPL